MRVKQAKKLKETTRDRHLAWIKHYVNNDFGIWIECTACKKWRKSYQYSESHEVPVNWCCSMGISDGKKGNCEDPEEDTGEEYFEYCPGSIVWARLDGYPWWPGMVDEDPDIEEYFFVDKGTRFYNVTFLDERVTHAWIPTTCMSSFLNPPPRNSRVQRQCKQNKYASAIMKAEERAQTALKMTIKERLNKFSFVYLYKGKWPLAEDFDGDTDEEDNPLDITDILLQEIDDLGSMNSSDTDDLELLESNTNLDFLPSEKKFIEQGFDYLKKKNEIESSNTKKHLYKTGPVQHKKKTLETGISKSEENTISKISLINKESSNSSSKKKVPSFIEKETDFFKRSKTSKLSIKKLKTENNYLESKVNILKNANFKKMTSEKEHGLMEIPKQNVYDKSVSPLINSINNSELIEESTIEEECIDVEKSIPIDNAKSNEVNSNEINDKESNSCFQISPLKDNAVNEKVREVNSIPHTENETNDKTEERGFQNSDSKFSNSFITEESNNIIANKEQSLDMDNSIYSEKMDTFLSHLDECITNVINCTSNETELPPQPVKMSKKMVTETNLPSMSIKTPKKKIKANEKLHCEPVRNVNEPEVITNGFDQTSSGIQKISKNKVISHPKDSKQNECKNECSSTVEKKNAKLVGYVKSPPKKHLISENSIDSPIKEHKIKTKVNESELNGNIVKKEKLSSTGHNNILNTGNKIKPDFKAVKRPFKKHNLSLKEDNVANKKQCTNEILNKRCRGEGNSFQDNLKNASKSNDIPLYNEVKNEQLPVLDEPLVKYLMKTLDEANLEEETKTNVGSKNSNAEEFASDTIGKDLEIITIDDEGNNNSDQNIKLEDKKDSDDCFFYVSVSDEE